MNLFKIYFFISILILSSRMVGFGQTYRNDFLISFHDSIKDAHGYKNQLGDTIIPSGKYSICFTDTFRTYAIVLKSGEGFIAIDRQEHKLYTIYPFDNGPDLVSDGLFRIIENSKIGFAESATGNVIISPQFECAWPFKNGMAKVSNECKEQSSGEHRTWISDKWYYIDKSGTPINRFNAK